jgi:hypothetical protein
MVKRDAGKLLWCGGRHRAMHRQNISRIEIHPGELVRAPGTQQFEYAQLDCFGDTPGEYALAAHAIFKLLLSFKQQDARSVLRDRSGKTGAPQTSSHDNEIVLLGHPGSSRLHFFSTEARFYFNSR